MQVRYHSDMVTNEVQTMCMLGGVTGVQRSSPLMHLRLGLLHSDLLVLFPHKWKGLCFAKLSFFTSDLRLTKQIQKGACKKQVM